MLWLRVMLDAASERWSEGLRQAAEAYARKAFDAALTLESLRPPGLPFFILDRYALWRGEIFGRLCAFMAPNPVGGDQGLGELTRHREIVRKLSPQQPLVLVFESLPAGLRRKLIAERIAFMVPGAQLFIPEMLLELRDGRSPKRIAAQASGRFSPTTQVVVIAALLQQDVDGASATALARRLGVAAMSMSRAFDELQAAGIADAKLRGRQRTLWMRFHGRALWQETERYLQSPVRKVRQVVIPYPEHFPGLVAGESALSLSTALAAPRTQTLAVAAAEWNRLVREHGLKMAEPGDAAADEVETWTYDPRALSRDRVVDRLSLYLSVRDHRDERVAQAAEQLLETVSW